MGALFCQKCKKAHPGRDCDYDDSGECAETGEVKESEEPHGEASGGKKRGSLGTDGTATGNRSHQES